MEVFQPEQNSAPATGAFPDNTDSLTQEATPTIFQKVALSEDFRNEARTENPFSSLIFNALPLMSFGCGQGQTLLKLCGNFRPPNSKHIIMRSIFKSEDSLCFNPLKGGH